MITPSSLGKTKTQMWVPSHPPSGHKWWFYLSINWSRPGHFQSLLGSSSVYVRKEHQSFSDGQGCVLSTWREDATERKKPEKLKSSEHKVMARTLLLFQEAQLQLCFSGTPAPPSKSNPSHLRHPTPARFLSLAIKNYNYSSYLFLSNREELLCL